MKLTQDQILQLYKFTKQKHVDWYEVQTELVDHLANDIEVILEDDQNLSFEKALRKCYKKFGIFGFSEIVTTKTSELKKHYHKLVWKEFISFFKLPKIIITVFIIWVLYLLLVNVKNIEFILLPSTVLVVFMPLINSYKNYKRQKKLQRLTGKKWLLDSILTGYGDLFSIFNLAFQLVLFAPDFFQWNLKFAFLLSIIIAFCFITLYVTIFVVNPNLQIKLKKEFPEYNLA